MIHSAHHHRPGYTFLVSVLIIGTVGVSLVTSTLLLSTTAAQTGISMQHGAKALTMARSCAEHAMVRLREDNTYAGGYVTTLNGKQCEVLLVAGFGNENRAICTEATEGGVTKRIEIIIDQLLPQVQVFSWAEVNEFSSCQYAT